MKKKILFIIWSFTYGGGAEKILANIVNNINHNKYDIEVLEYLHSDISSEQVDEKVRLLKPILDSTNKSIFNRIKVSLMSRILIRYCPSLVRKFYLNKEYDVEISFNYLIPTFLLNRKSSKLISWVHSSIEDLEDNYGLQRMQKKYFGRVDQIVTISEHTEQSVIRLYPDFTSKVKKIYNGYDFNIMVPDITPVDSFQLLYCNRLDENKNPQFLLEVAKRLKEDNVFFKLKMLGRGELLDDLKKYVCENDLESEVEFLGYVKNPYAYFARSRIFCLSSNIEGFPTSLVEAMYFGKPFVTTPVAGSKELSNNEQCGFVAQDIDEFTQKVKQLLLDDVLYSEMSQNCIKEISNYTIAKQIEKIEALIDA